MTAADHHAQIQATLDLLAEKYPHCFHLCPDRRRPLKVGIHTDLLRAGAIGKKRMKRFLKVYANGVGYLRNSVQGAWRYDLTGNHVGEVTADEAADAKQRLAWIEKRKADRAAAKKAAEEAAEIARRGPRLSLADLKAAALARKAAATIKNSSDTGAITTYRRFNKPALGPLGDSLGVE